ncbi:3-oxoacyl-ACP synthase III family protein [Bdellovibrionota bacterium]
MRRSVIVGTGQYVPPKVVTNDDLATMMDTSDEWIRQRSGIRERRFVEKQGIGPSDLGLKAAQQALDDADMVPQDLDCIIFATLSPDMFFPGSSGFLQAQLGVPGIAALDVRTQCTGFIYSLSVADQFIRTGMYKNVLVVGAEVHSSGLDYSDQGRDVTVLFGDGAGAVVLKGVESSDRGILSTHLHADGRFAKELCMEAPTSRYKPHLSEEMLKDRRQFPSMNGKLVFVHAIKRFPEVIKEAVQANGMKLEDINLLIPHQANQRITMAVAEQLGLNSEKVFSNIEKYGNTTAASIPIALNEACREGRVKSGDLVCLAAFGSGFTWASALIRW